jgi:hypothetical protein
MKNFSMQFSLSKNYLVFFVFVTSFLCSISGVFGQSIPSPKEFFGIPIGADHLTEEIKSGI